MNDAKWDADYPVQVDKDEIGNLAPYWDETHGQVPQSLILKWLSTTSASTGIWSNCPPEHVPVLVRLVFSGFNSLTVGTEYRMKITLKKMANKEPSLRILFALQLSSLEIGSGEAEIRYINPKLVEL